MIPVVLILIIAYVLTRDSETSTPQARPSPAFPLQLQRGHADLPGAQAPGGAHDAGAGAYQPPNEHNTGDVNCVDHPDVCKAWADNNSREGIRNFQTVQSTVLSVVPGGSLINKGLDYLENEYWVGEGSPSVAFVGCDHSLPIGAPVKDSAGNPASNCSGVSAPPTSAQLDQKYAAKRSGGFVPHAQPVRHSVRK